MIGGRILDVSAIVGFATSMPYPQAVVFTALEQNVVLAIPSGALAEAWSQARRRDRDALMVLLGLPVTVVVELEHEPVFPADYASTAVKDGANVEIVTIAAGG